jgi:fatty-acyl-CoA synthase
MSEAAPASIAEGIALEQQPGLGDLTIGGFLREVARRYGPAEAVSAWDGERRIAWSYDTLLSRSLAVARALIATGAGKDSRVGIMMTNRPEFLCAMFGTALAGAVCVSLSTFSTPTELQHLLKASQVSTLLFERRVAAKDFLEMLTGIEPAIVTALAPGRLASDSYPFLQRLVCLQAEIDASDATDPSPEESGAGGAIESWRDFLAHGASISDALVLARADSVAPGDPGGIYFSSGTTNLPKGIVHAHRAFAIQWWRWAWIMAWPAPVRIWTGNGLFWSGNVVMMVGIAFSTGGAVILQRMFEAGDALRLIERERVSFLSGRPHQWAQLQAAPGWSAADLSSIKYVTRGELIWQHPTVNTDWVVPMAFGATETMTVCTGFPTDTPAAVWADSCGRPHPGNTLKIVDAVTQAVVPRGELGELCIKGPTLMIGYLGKLPEQCFDAEGFFHTGDAGYVDDQDRFFWKGRMTGIIKTGGANVSPEEVDEVIALYPGVRRTQTVGIPDDLLGEKVVACIVPRAGETLEESAIKAFVKQRLASFKVPRIILFLTEGDLAVTGSEKIKVSELREIVLKRLGKAAG